MTQAQTVLISDSDNSGEQESTRNLLKIRRSRNVKSIYWWQFELIQDSDWRIGRSRNRIEDFSVPIYIFSDGSQIYPSLSNPLRKKKQQIQHQPWIQAATLFTRMWQSIRYGLENFNLCPRLQRRPSKEHRIHSHRNSQQRGNHLRFARTAVSCPPNRQSEDSIKITRDQRFELVRYSRWECKNPSSRTDTFTRED